MCALCGASRSAFAVDCGKVVAKSVSMPIVYGYLRLWSVCLGRWRYDDENERLDLCCRVHSAVLFCVLSAAAVTG